MHIRKINFSDEVDTVIKVTILRPKLQKKNHTAYVFNCKGIHMHMYMYMVKFCSTHGSVLKMIW